MTTWTIKGEKGMTGTVKESIEYPGHFEWYIDGISGWIGFGMSSWIPSTYVDSSGTDQMAMIDGNNVYLDHSLSGNPYEETTTLDKVTIIDQGLEITKIIYLWNEVTCSSYIHDAPCSDWGSSRYSNWTEDKWLVCQSRCTVCTTPTCNFVVY